MTENPLERQDTLLALKAAVDRLTAPRAKPTVTAVAELAAVSRATAHRYEEALAYLEERRMTMPEHQVVELHKQIAELKREHWEEVKELRDAIEILAQRVQILTIALQQERDGKPQGMVGVTDIASRRREQEHRG